MKRLAVAAAAGVLSLLGLAAASPAQGLRELAVAARAPQTRRPPVAPL